HVALHGVDQVRDQVMAALQLDVDLGPRLLGSVSGRDQAVVGEDKPQQDQNDDYADDDPTHFWGLSYRLSAPATRERASPNGSSSASSCACACASSCAAF